MPRGSVRKKLDKRDRTIWRLKLAVLLLLAFITGSMLSIWLDW
jgi:hypothetical protein